MATKKLVIVIEIDDYPEDWFINKVESDSIELDDTDENTTLFNVVNSAFNAEDGAIESKKIDTLIARDRSKN